MSAILSADDLNDFISPGVACIKPLVSEPKHSEYNENGEVDIQLDQDGNPLEVSKIDGKQTTLSAAQISLADCLACSGCITSAEEILVAQHSHDQLIKALTEKMEGQSNKVFVASISHQSRASLATAFDLKVDEVDKLLVNLFVNQMGFNYIVGTALGRKLSLIHESQSLIQKKELGEVGPTLSSICPGWVLYAEKTHPYILPRISTVKSPQQITGCILKSLTAHDLGVPRENVYHLSIMPCFDKKLESARPEEHDEVSPDVDCVLTAKELIALLDQHPQFQLIPPNYNNDIFPKIPLNDIYKKCAPTGWPFVENSWSNDTGSASGGYGYNYLKMFQNHLVIKNNYNQEDFSIQTIGGRNSDIYELRLLHNGSAVASSAVVNGFRNIQNLVRKLKPNPKASKAVAGKSNPLAARRRARLAQKGEDATLTAGTDESADASKCDYVEIMACPNGCINGGGQINPPTDVPEKEWLQVALQNYNSIPLFDLNGAENVHAIQDLLQWSQAFCEEFGMHTDRLLKTHFNEVEKPTDQGSILLGAKW